MRVYNLLFEFVSGLGKSVFVGREAFEGPNLLLLRVFEEFFCALRFLLGRYFLVRNVGLVGEDGIGVFVLLFLLILFFLLFLLFIFLPLFALLLFIFLLLLLLSLLLDLHFVPTIILPLLFLYHLLALDFQLQFRVFYLLRFPFFLNSVNQTLQKSISLFHSFSLYLLQTFFRRPKFYYIYKKFFLFFINVSILVLF